MNKNQIIARALERLKAQTGLKGKWTPLPKDIDGEIDLLLNTGRLHLFVGVKKELRQHQLPQLLKIAKRYQPFMVVAERIFPTLKETLRQKKIGYLDTAGNIYMNVNDRFIWLDGNKHLEEQKPATNRAFTKTGLKTVFYLLLHPDAINLPYRQLAKATNVALGNINNVIAGLKDTGFILRIDKKKIRLQNKKALLERWITGYREILKPALHIANYHFWDKDKFANWQDLPLIRGKDFWGGDPAADLLTHYLNPAILTLYTHRNPAMIIPQWTLVPDEKGYVQLYEKFWIDEEADKQKYAPPLLVYADLLLTDDPRCIETAGMIYNKYLKHEFE